MSSLPGGSGIPSYEQKLEKLQRYLPFLQKMINKLERTNDPARSAQLQKMKHLHAILTDSSRKLKYELLVKCEGVLQKLHDKIEGESDDDVMELPHPGRPVLRRPPPPPPPPREPQRRLLYPESEWERPSPPREIQRSAPGSSGTSRHSDDPPVHSPPLSSFVERISMSSPSTRFNDMDQPRSPSPEVVAQIPGAFAGKDHKDKKFEKGREILRKLMIGMSKTLDETEVERESSQDIAVSAARGPKIIPLERENSNNTPDAEIPVDDIEGSGCSGNRQDPRSSSAAKPSENADAYNPEDEWSEARKKHEFRPSFMSKPPLSKEDLEELNRDLGSGSTPSGSSDERKQEASDASSKGQRSGDSDKGRRNSVDDRSEKEDRRVRTHSNEKRLELRKGETVADAKRRRFEEWKKAEIEKRKKRKAELKHSSQGKSRHDSSRSSSIHEHRREHDQDHSSSHKSDRSTSRDRSVSTPDGTKEKVKMKTATVDLTADSRAQSTSKDLRAKMGPMKDPRKAGDQHLDEVPEPPKKTDATVEKLSEQLKKYTVQELVKTVHDSMSPIAKKKEPVDDLEQTFKCLVIRNLPPNTLRQDIFRLFHGFGIVELVLEVHFSFTCAGIAYAQLAEHSEAKRARKELADKMVHGCPVKIAPCADGIFREAKRTYEQTMNAREEQYAKRQSPQTQLTPPLAGTQYPHQSHPSPVSAPAGYRPQYPSHPHGAPVPLMAAATGIQRPAGSGLLRYPPQQVGGHPRTQSPRFPLHSTVPRTSTPPRPSMIKHNFNNPYNVQPGRGDKNMPSKDDPRRAAQMSYHEQKKQQLEKELEILRRHDEEKERRREKERRLQKEKSHSHEKHAASSGHQRMDSHKSAERRPVGERKATSSKPVSEHKAASLGKFKIPKIKRPEPVTKPEETSVEKQQSLAKPEETSVKKPQPIEKPEEANIKKHRSVARPEEVNKKQQSVAKQGENYFKEQEKPEEANIRKHRSVAQPEEVTKKKQQSVEKQEENCLKEPVSVTKTKETSVTTPESLVKESPRTPEAAPEPVLPITQPVTCHQEDTVSSTVNTDDLELKQKRKRSRVVVISDTDSEPEVDKADEITSRRDAEQPAAESRVEHKKSRPIVEHLKGVKKIEQQQPESSSSVRKRLVSDSKSTVESESDACETQESDTDRTDAELTPTTEAMQALSKTPMIVLRRADPSAAISAHVDERKHEEKDRLEPSQKNSFNVDVMDMETSPIESSVSALKEEAGKEMDCFSDSLQKGEGHHAGAESVKGEAQDAEVIHIPTDSTVGSSDLNSAVVKPETESIEPEECDCCSFNGKKIIYHYIISHPGKSIPVKMQKGMLEAALNEELGPGEDSAKQPLEKDLEEKLLNDDLSWIPSSLMFDYNIACQYCKFTAMNKRHMLQHIADHLQTGTSAPDKYSIKCRFCKVKSVNSHEMVDHISSHTGEYRYSCQHCGYRVFRMYYLKSHMSSMHRGCALDAITIEDADIGNGWVYGYACKLCGYVQLHERNVKKHMDDVHDGSTEYTKINMCTKGPQIDISKKVNDARRRKKAEDEKRAASMPAPIEDMSVFAVGERWLRERAQEEAARRADMGALAARFSQRLAVPGGQTGGELLEKLKGAEETPLQYLEEMRRRALEKPAKLEEPAEPEPEPEESPSQEPDAKKDSTGGSEVAGPEQPEPPWEGDASEGAEEPLPPPPPLDDVLGELRTVRPEDPAQFGYQVTVKLAAALRPQPEPQSPGVAIKQEPGDQLGFSAEASAGLNAMNADLESLMNDFDRFEREQETPRPKLRLRKLSGDLLSSDEALGGGLGGLMISSVMSLTGGTEADQSHADAAAKKAEDLFAFPPEGERRPWKYFLTLKDQSKVMRLMFHMHHKSAYKCNAVHCSLTTNNGTLFKLHLRNHEKCDVCTPDETAYTCMNTRLVCVYCGYKGADLAEHVYKRHAMSQFQCGYCFYRTKQNAYMHEHQRRWHADMPTYFLQSDPANPPPGLNASHLVETEMVGESSLTPYICAQEGCEQAFIKAAVLEQHYKDAHPLATAFPCHVCGLRAPSFAALIGHYVSHGFVAYHCAYCSYANQDQNDVKKHLIDFHPDDPPKCYARIPKTMNVVLGVPEPPAPPPAPLPSIPAASVKQEPGLGPDSLAAPGSPAAAVKQEPEPERPASESQVELEEAGDSAAQPPPPPAAAEPPAEPPPLVAEELYRCGNPKCSERFPTLPSFKDHMLSCAHGENGVLLCFHCPKQVKHVSTALEHIRLHGPKRYSCALCDFSAPVPSYVTKHLKQQHRMSSCTTLPLLAEKTDPERDQFVVYPRQCVPRAEQPPAASGPEHRGFGVDDLEQLPHRPVLFRPVHCKLCPYSSKVTRNLLKHLLRHKRSDGTAPLPVTTPSNPRPCDQRGAKMFDQMANLASGSGEVGVPRKAEELSQADLERLPKEVTEDKRYICSIPGCVYLTLNDTMLKYHIQALHGQMITYPCPHCKDLYMIPDKLSTHLRLHGPRLYKCKYCIYNHYQRSLVMRHVRDKHPMLPMVDVVVREPDDDEATRPLFKPWRCGLCKYQALLQPEVVEHVSAVHDLRSQFKCGLCSMRSSVRSAFDLHFASKHPDESVSVFAIYYKLDEADAEAAVKVEHCQPIWQRNNPRRIRHVRGILIEEVKVSRGSPVKRKAGAAAPKSPAKKPAVERRTGRSGAKGAAGQARRRAIKRALRQTASGRLRQLAAADPEPEQEEPEPEPEQEQEEPRKPEPEQESPRKPEPELVTLDEPEETKPDSPKPAPATEDEFLSLFETKSCELGPKGDADVETKQFVCPRCSKYKTKRKRDFQMHLYKELGYNRFVCGNCGHMNTTMPNMKRHHEMMHKAARLPEAIVPLTPDSAQEEWIEAVLDHQERQIEGRPPAEEQPKQTKQEVKPEESTPASTPASTPTKPEAKPAPQAAAEAEPKPEPEPQEPSPTAPRPAPTPESPSTPIYKCCYCDERGTIPQLRGHWKTHHPNLRFKLLKMMQRYACNHCPFQSAKIPLVRAHLADKHPGAPPSDYTTRAHDRLTRFKCGWCQLRFATRAKAEAHHGTKHPTWELRVETYTARSSAVEGQPAVEPTVDESAIVEPSQEEAKPTVPDSPVAGKASWSSSQPGGAPAGAYRCPLCPYSHARLKTVDTHLLNVHYKRFKCETCGYVDGKRMAVLRHHNAKHSGEPRVTLLEHLDLEFKQMKRALRGQPGPAAARPASPARSDVTTGSRGSRGTKRSSDGVSPARKRLFGPASAVAARATRLSRGGVARKSTAGARAARVGRGVAIKSTSGVRRCPSPYSFYGSRPLPIDSFSEVTTQLTLGGATSMRVNVPTLAQIVKLYPRCRVVDLRRKRLAL